MLALCAMRRVRRRGEGDGEPIAVSGNFRGPPTGTDA